MASAGRVAPRLTIRNISDDKCDSDLARESAKRLASWRCIARSARAANGRRSPMSSGAAIRFFAPDISGYGANGCALDLPLTLAEEVRAFSGTLNDAEGPIHLVGHSYGGAIAFKIATSSPFAHRLRSLTLIEPVLPTLLCESDADRRLHARFAQVAQRGFRGPLERIGAGGDRQVHRVLERLRSAGSAAGERAPAHDRARPQACLRFHGGVRRRECRQRGGLASRSDAAVFGRAVALSHPAHRAAARRDHDGAEIRHLPGAGHMLPLTHASIVNPAIVRHIARADELAGVPLALDAAPAEAVSRSGRGDVLGAWLAGGLLVSQDPEPGTECR